MSTGCDIMMLFLCACVCACVCQPNAVMNRGYNTIRDIPVSGADVTQPPISAFLLSHEADKRCLHVCLSMCSHACLCVFVTDRERVGGRDADGEF